MEDADILDWMREARSIQNDLFSLFGSIEFHEVEYKLLTKKVGLALFGYPLHPDDSQCTEYSEDKKLAINAVVTQILSTSRAYEEYYKKDETGKEVESDKIYLALIYGLIREMSSKKDSIKVIFKVKGYEDNEINSPKTYFIDQNANVYENWENLLSSTLFSDCYMCWPQGGTYSKDPQGITNLTFDRKNDLHVWHSRGLRVWNFFHCKVVLGQLSLVSYRPIQDQENTLIAERKYLLDKAEKLVNLSCFCIPQVRVINGLVDIFLKFKEGEADDKDVLNFSLSCFFLFNVDIMSDMANKMLRELTQHHLNTIGIVPLGTSFPKQVFKNKFFYEPIALLIGIPTVIVDSLKLENLIFNLKDNSRSVHEGKIDSKKYFTRVTEIMEQLWKIYSDIAKEGLDSCCSWRFSWNPKINKAHNLESNGRIVPTILNFEIMHEIYIIVKKTVWAMIGLESVEKERVVMRLFNEFDKLNPAKNLLECLNKLNFFCEHLKNKHTIYVDNHEHEFDIGCQKKLECNNTEYNVLNRINPCVREHFFSKIREFTMEDFNKLNYAYKKYKPYISNNFRSFHYKNIFPFCYPPNMVFTDKDFFAYATEFAKTEINEKNCRISKENCTAIIQPLVHNKVPKVIFYIPKDFDYSVGISVVDRL